MTRDYANRMRALYYAVLPYMCEMINPVKTSFEIVNGGSVPAYRGDLMKWKCPKCGREFSRQDQDHYCIKPQNIDEYIAAQDEYIQPVLREVRTILQSALPEAEERISWSMPTYWKGRNIIHFAASKNHLGIYPGDVAAAAFANELADYDTGKGTIRLPYEEPLPAELIRTIAEWCFEKYAK